MSTLLNDWSYDDWHRDSEDKNSSISIYNDHFDKEPSMPFWTHQYNKPEADKARQAYRYYRYGYDSYIVKIL